MDLKVTGKFIQERRKAKGFTQAELAEKIGVSEKTVSKWECAGGFPDTSLMLPLCEALQISANELLSGKLLNGEEYKISAEKHLLVLKSQQEKLAKNLLTIEIVLIVFAVLFLVGCALVAEFVPMTEGLQVLIVCFGVLMTLIAAFFGIQIERTAGFYECAYCHKKHIPTYGGILLAPHMGWTRYMKCPHCGKRSWQKKKLHDDCMFEHR